MPKHLITEAVHVDLRVDGQTISADYEPGEVELHPEVAALLSAHGIATPVYDVTAEPVAAKPAKKPTAKTTNTETLGAE